MNSHPSLKRSVDVFKSARHHAKNSDYIFRERRGDQNEVIFFDWLAQARKIDNFQMIKVAQMADHESGDNYQISSDDVGDFIFPFDAENCIQCSTECLRVVNHFPFVSIVISSAA